MALRFGCPATSESQPAKVLWIGPPTLCEFVCMTIRDRIPSIPPFLQHYALTSSTHSALTIRNYLRSIATLHSYQGSAQGTPALAMLPRTTLTLTINFSFCLRLAVATCFPLANNKAQNLFGSSSHRSMSLLLLASSWDEHWSKKISSFQVYSPELYKYDMKRCNLISSALELDSGQSIVGVAVMITPPLNLPSVSLGSTKSTLWSLEQTPIYTSWFTDSCTKFDT